MKVPWAGGTRARPAPTKCMRWRISVVEIPTARPTRLDDSPVEHDRGHGSRRILNPSRGVPPGPGWAAWP